MLAAFIEGIRQVAVPPDTQTLRADLLLTVERSDPGDEVALYSHKTGAVRYVAIHRLRPVGCLGFAAADAESCRISLLVSVPKPGFTGER